MTHYPAFLDLRGRLALVVGGGEVALRKVEGLLQAGAGVRLVSPAAGPKIVALAGEGRLELVGRAYESEDLDGVSLVISATDSPEVNRQVAADARDRGVWVNVVDEPALCDFVVPAVVRRGDLTLAVGTGGASPAAARKVRERLMRQFGPEWGPYLRIMAAVRKRVLAKSEASGQNRRVFGALADSDLVELVARRDWDGVDRLLAETVDPGCGLAALDLASAELEAG